MAQDRPIPPDLAARLDTARIRAGFSIHDLARACSLEEHHLFEVLTGVRPLSPAVARRLLAALHLHESVATEVMEHAHGPAAGTGDEAGSP